MGHDWPSGKVLGCTREDEVVEDRATPEDEARFRLADEEKWWYRWTPAYIDDELELLAAAQETIGGENRHMSGGGNPELGLRRARAYRDPEKYAWWLLHRERARLEMRRNLYVVCSDVSMWADWRIVRPSRAVLKHVLSRRGET
jgi:hypothetical protein